MPFSIQADPASKVLVATCSGILHPGDARAGASAYWENPEWRGRPIVWDCREARFEMTSEEIAGLARFILARQPAIPPARVAFVAGSEVDFGLARMFEALRDDPATEVRVFRELDAAIAWAGGA